MDDLKNKKKIVIVDDDEDLLSALTVIFESEGFEVHGFTLGKEALKYLLPEEHLNSCSLLILDRLLPDMDGLEILSTLNARNPSHCPVFILSLLSSDKDVLSGLKTGAADYITKPFNLEVFTEKAKKIIRE